MKQGPHFWSTLHAVYISLYPSAVFETLEYYIYKATLFGDFGHYRYIVIFCWNSVPFPQKFAKELRDPPVYIYSLKMYDCLQAKKQKTGQRRHIETRLSRKQAGNTW